MADPKPWSEAELIELAARGAGRIVFGGPNGPHRVTWDEVAAMAALLVLFGLRPIQPGSKSPQPITDLLPSSKPESKK